MLKPEFITAGRALFTVTNDKGTHYTFKITHEPADGQWPETWFISMLTGSNNESDYTYLGVLNPWNFSIKFTKKSPYNADSLPIKVLVWAFRLIRTGTEPPAGYSVHHEGKCCRCGRTLTVPESIESGIGPECAKLMGL